MDVDRVRLAASRVGKHPLRKRATLWLSKSALIYRRLNDTTDLPVAVAVSVSTET